MEAAGRPVPPPAFELLKEGDAPVFESGANLVGADRGGYLPEPETLSILDTTPHPPKPDYLKPLAAFLAVLLFAVAFRVAWYYSTNRVDLGASPIEQATQPSSPAAPATPAAPNRAAVDDTIYFAPNDVMLPVLQSKADAQGTSSGKVVLLVVIDRTGKPVSPQVWQGLDPDLNIRAMAAVSKWRFRPATKDGRPVPVTAQVQVAFRN